MKKLFLLAAMPFCLALGACQSTPQKQTSDGPIESKDSPSAIHGRAGVGVSSQNTSGITPERPSY
jgi:hypothetical protein